MITFIEKIAILAELFKFSATYVDMSTGDLCPNFFETYFFLHVSFYGCSVVLVLFI